MDSTSAAGSHSSDLNGASVYNGLQQMNFSNKQLSEFPEADPPTEEGRKNIVNLRLHHNSIAFIPQSIAKFSSLVELNVSNNNLSHIAEEISALQCLQVFVAKNNCLDDESLPKTFDQLHSLRRVDLGGNNLTEFPPQLVHLPDIRSLLLGSNKIQTLPTCIDNIQSLEVLNLGGNLLNCIPAEVGFLSNLAILNLAGNRLQSLPKTLIRLRNLKSLSLHNNKLATLPPEIVSIGLEELSLRNNPLVVRFIQSMTYDVPSLMELSGRAIKLAHLPYRHSNIPATLEAYLNSANKCVNPRCKGVFFTAKIEHVKFVDFCGKYKLPLLQYLCSPKCSDKRPLVEGSSDSESESDEVLAEAHKRMKRVLLG